MVKYQSAEDTGFKRVLGVFTRWYKDVKSTHLEAPLGYRGSIDHPLPPVEKHIYFPEFEADDYNFIERSEMAELDERFQSVEQGRGKGFATMVLYGMGGCGKTQLALSDCRRALASPGFGGVMWVDGTSLVTVKESFAMAAQEMLLMENVDHNTSVPAVFKLMEKSGLPWLFVFDNFDDPKAYDIGRFLPKRGQRLTIITSRRTETGRLGHGVRIGDLGEEEALRLLLGKDCDAGPDSALAIQGRRIADRLGYLAMAIAQAGAFIQDRNMDLSFFLSAYETKRQEIHKSLPTLWRYERRGSGSEAERIQLSIATTWELSLNLISGGTPHVMDAKERLLMVSAFSGRTNITEGLFQAYARSCSNQPSWISTFIDPRRQGELDMGIFRESIAEMGRLCLLQSYQVDSHGATWQFHPVVQDWAQNRQGPEMREALAMEALDMLQYSLGVYGSASILDSQYPLHTHQNLRPHMEACYANCEGILLRGMSLKMARIADAAQRMANFFSLDGRHDLSRTLQEKIAREAPAGSPQEKWARRHIAKILAQEHKLAKAAEIQEKLVGSQIPGKEGVDDAFQLLELSRTYHTQAEFPQEFPDTEKKRTESSALASKALSIMQRLRGEGSLEAVSAMLALAEVKYQAGRYKDAMALEEKVLFIRTQLLGDTNSATLDAKDSLAVTYAKLGRCDTAAEMHAQVGTIRRETLGKLHPDTLKTERWLARAWRLHGHVAKARALNEDILQRALGTYGNGHYTTKRAANALWRCLIEQGLVPEADRVQGEYELELADSEIDMRQRALSRGG